MSYPSWRQIQEDNNNSKDNSDYEHEIIRLTDTAISCKDIEVKKKVIDVLQEYGEQGIAPIHDIIDLNQSSEVKLYGLDAIKRIKQDITYRRLMTALK